MAELNLICQYSGLPSLASYLIDQEESLLAAKKYVFNDHDHNRILEMAWEDRTPFEAIEFQFGLKEKEVIEYMRKNSLASSFRMWRKRMHARKTKHAGQRDKTVIRFKCSQQRGTGNKIAKRR